MSADLILVSAAIRGDVRDLRRALAAGANPNFHDPPYGRTSLQFAASYLRLEVVTILLSAGAHVDATSTDLSTPLLLAVVQFDLSHDKMANQRAIIKALVAAGADVHAQNSGDRSPFTWALTIGHRWMLLEFLRAGTDINASSILIPTKSNRSAQFLVRSPDNASAWALVDAVKKAGGFDEYARRQLGIHVSILTKCFGTPVDVATIVAGFYAPRGFY